MDSATASFGVKLSELCGRIGIRERDARYVLHHGLVPDGIDIEPGQGNHRVFNWEQAFWLAMVLKLKAAGLKPRLAADIATWSRRLKGLTRSLNWDGVFSPFDGDLMSDRRWIVEVGDGDCVRVLTDANPSHRGLRDESGWVDLSSGKQAGDVQPSVIVQVDISGLARQLAG